MTINNESLSYNNERINFYNCCLEIEKKMSMLSSNLSESAILKTALSKSTFNLLIESNNNTFDFFNFWKPVSETINSKKRLQKRMLLYGVEQKKRSSW